MLLVCVMCDVWFVSVLAVLVACDDATRRSWMTGRKCRGVVVVVLLLALRVRGVELGRVCVMAGCVRCMMLMGDVRCVYDEVCGCECSMFDVMCDVRALCVRVCACKCVIVHLRACWLAWCAYVYVYAWRRR